MSSMLERLRQLHKLRPQHVHTDDFKASEEEPMRSATIRGAGIPSTRRTLEEIAPGQVVATEAGACYLSVARYPLTTIHGVRPLGELLHHAPWLLAQHHPHFNLTKAANFAEAAFIDTETTGLGGAGSYCFMVGVGTFEAYDAEQHASNLEGGPAPPQPSHFVVRQFFMRHPGEEPALLLALSQLLSHHTLIVTFNGRSFDAPLLRSRYLQNKRLLPPTAAPRLLFDDDAPHLDLLTPARRLWKRRLRSCRLINLEEQILLLQRTEDDVPGSLIPQLYIDYLANGDAGEMRRVFYHNGQDIVSMAALTERIYRLLHSGEGRRGGVGELHGLDWLSLGSSHERAGKEQAAENAYHQAIETLVEPKMQAEAFRRLGQLQKQQGRWREAAATWERWLTTVPGADATPFIELAKACEWQFHDLEQAEMWTGWALHMLNTLPAWQRLPGQMADLERRMTRLRRKRGDLSAGNS